MAGIISSMRLYSALASAALQFLLSQLYRKALGTKHPMGWPVEQEFTLLLFRQVFRYASIPQCRAAIVSATAKEVPGVLLTRVPGSTFKAPGWRDSWWVELLPEQHPAKPRATLVLLYLHGGGWVCGDPLMYRPTFKTWMQRLAEQGIHMRIFAVGYPLAPEHRFPGGLLGAVAAYDWLVQQLGGSECIVMGGDSAGGNLAIAALEYMRQRAAGCIDPALTAAASHNAAKTNSSSTAAVPFHPPAAALLVSPAVDLSSSSVFGLPDAEVAKLFEYDYVTKSEAADAGVHRRYLPTPLNLALLEHPLISPIFMAGFEGLVRPGGELLVVAGGSEGMTRDITRFVEHAKAVSPGVRLRYHIEPDEPHCWCVLGMPHLIAKGLPVLLPFFVQAAAAK